MTALAAHHYTMLHTDSAIDDAIITTRGYQSLTHPDDLRDLGFSKVQARTAPALALPIWDVHGQQTGWQLRPDHPRMTKAGKLIKYENPTGSRLHLDVHPSMHPLLGDPQSPLWITEGVKKGDALVSRGACTIALMGGVWGFKGTNEHGGKVILPDWQHVALNDRLVYVVYDSDIYLKPNVDAALKALYRFLRERQARPGLVRWPEEYRHTKIGVDDFFAQGHTLDDVLALVPPIGPLPTRFYTHPNGSTPERPSTEPPLPYSDYTNALAFVREHGQDLHYCYPWKSWLVWTGRCWERDTSGAVMRLAKLTVKRLARQVENLDEDAANALMAHIKASLSTAKLKALVECAQSEEGIPVQPADLDTDPWLLNCANGTLDLRTGELRPHQQSDLLTKCLPLAYDPDAHCQQWLIFLEHVMQGNAELIVFLQRALGYSLTGSTREQCFFLLHGPTKTGKSTFMHLAKALLGSYGTQAEMSTFLHKERETVRNDLADLAGMRLVCAIETDEGKRLAEALIKQLTGGTDTIKARFLFEEYFEYRPQFKVFLATNHKPKVNPGDDALWERIRLIPFVVQIPKDERDKELETKLRAELPGILAWVVRGCLAWQRDKSLGEPAAVVEATQGYRDEMDTLAQFLEECCVSGPAAVAKVKASLLASAYQAWCKRTGNMPLANLAFIKTLEDRGYTRERGTANQYYWNGLGLVDTSDERYEAREKTDAA
jgi:putative DNA primase/helicase